MLMTLALTAGAAVAQQSQVLNKFVLPSQPQTFDPAPQPQAAAPSAQAPPADAARQRELMLRQHETVLRQSGVAPTAEEIGQLLRQFGPGAHSAAQTAKLIKRLGDDDYYQRQAAMQSLRRMPVIPVQALQKAALHNDAEIAFRARRLLGQAGSRNMDGLLIAAFETVRLKGLRGLASVLLDASSVSADSEVTRQARRALAATVTGADAELLHEALKSDESARRRAAVSAVAALGQAGAADRLAPLVKDADGGVRVEAARALANLGDRRSLSALAGLLDDADVAVRAEAAGMLRGLTGQEFGFIAYDADAQRAAAVGKWRAWIAAQGATAKLRVPVPDTLPMLGRTLIALYGEGRVIDVDASGKVLREIRDSEGRSPWSVQALPGGHVLVTWYSSGLVGEYDASGKRVWVYRSRGGSVWSAKRLVNGNTLVAVGPEAIEVDRSGAIVGRQRFRFSLMDVQRLANGNTLASLTDNSVVEADRNGQTVWETRNVRTPYRIQRLSNGNTLICEHTGSRVVEYNRNKQIVWSNASVTSPDSAQRLPDGTTLITNTQGVYLFSRTGEQLWRYKTSRAVAVRY